MLKLKTFSKCFGCSACANKCPVGAISMKSNDEGFEYPEVDASKCINCDLCNKVCPAYGDNFEYKTFDASECRAITNANDEVRMSSSSGGVFTLISEYVRSLGGGEGFRSCI